MNRKEYIIMTGILILSICISSWLSHVSVSSGISKVHYEVMKSLEVEHNSINLMRGENKVLREELKVYAKEKAEAKAEQQQIINNYKTVYETINNTNDTAQFNITLELLAKHRSTKLER